MLGQSRPDAGVMWWVSAALSSEHAVAFDSSAGELTFTTGYRSVSLARRAT